MPTRPRADASGIRQVGRSLRRPRVAITAHRIAAAQRARLAGHRLFASCSRRELRVLQRWGDELELPADVVLLRKDAIGRCVIAVLEGSVCASTGARRTERITCGGWVGDRAVLAFAPEPATVITETPCRLFTLGARPALSFCLDMAAIRAVLFPSLDEPAAIAHVRALRADGLASWRRLGGGAPRPVVEPALPDWLQVHRSQVTRTGHGIGARVDASQPGSTAPSVRRHLQHPRRVAAIAVTLAVALLASVAATVHVPYYSVRGSTRSAIEAVDVSTRAGEQSGVILFPIIDVSKATPLRALRDWHDDAADLHTTKDVLGGQSAADLERANLRMMAEAKRNAVAAVGALLADVTLDPGTVQVDSGDIGGPSAGLAFALALIDESTPGDLTGGEMVAATGELGSDGSVRAVGGTRLKTLAARRAGCGLLIVPRANLDEARAVAGHMKLLAVDSLAEAVQKLVAAGGAIVASQAEEPLSD